MVCYRPFLLALLLALGPLWAHAQTKPKPSPVYYPDADWQRRFINAYDMARFGYLTLRRGKWKDRQLLSNRWVDWALTPTQPQLTYGFMNWYLNKAKDFLPAAPASAFAHVGNGTNIIYVDPDNDLVAVLRWIDRPAINEFVRQHTAAVSQK